MIQSARAAGFTNINIDLLCGLPTQTLESWIDSVERGIHLEPEHICVFPVSVRHPGIPIYRNRDQLPALDLTRRMYNAARDRLFEAGYVRTTRHNFVRPPQVYRYEKMIAELAPLVALGANSIGYSEDFIYRNTSDLQSYLTAIESGQVPVKSGYSFVGSERWHNYAVRGIEYLRLSGSVFFELFGTRIEEAFPEQIRLLQEFGLAILEGGDLQLTEDGTYFTAAVKRLFFHESALRQFEKGLGNGIQIERQSLRTRK